MEIIINHLTKMRWGYICVAGIARDGRHWRPVLEPHPDGRHTQLQRSLLRSNKGPFELGAVVDLGKVSEQPTPPHLEDVVFNPDKAKFLHHQQSESFIDRIAGAAKNSLHSIFGQELQPQSKTAAFTLEDQGRASLGVLRLDDADLTAEHKYGKHAVRLEFEDPDLGVKNLKVNDLRLWEEDQRTPAAGNIEQLQGQLEGCLISVGLTRAPKENSDIRIRGKHWLQVNNIFPRHDPFAAGRE